VIFSLETITLSIVQEDYFLSFFFWMDTIGTISLILDIGWISNRFLPDHGARSKGSLLRLEPTAYPTLSPTEFPTLEPTAYPSETPTDYPTLEQQGQPS
jgi:hypothetical protein